MRLARIKGEKKKLTEHSLDAQASISQYTSLTRDEYKVLTVSGTQHTSSPPTMVTTIVLDNGASTIKVGIVNKDEQPRLEFGTQMILPLTNTFGILTIIINRIIPNAVIRSKGDKATYFGHELAQCKDYSSLHYRLPFEKVWKSHINNNNNNHFLTKVLF